MIRTRSYLKNVRTHQNKQGLNKWIYITKWINRYHIWKLTHSINSLCNWKNSDRIPEKNIWNILAFLLQKVALNLQFITKKSNFCYKTSISGIWNDLLSSTCALLGIWRSPVKVKKISKIFNLMVKKFFIA